MATLRRPLQSQRTPLVCVSDAGPCGSWLSRSLLTKGDVCWVVAPAVMPNKPGDRGNTDRRDARHLARLRRSGALPRLRSPPSTMKPAALGAERGTRPAGICTRPSAGAKPSGCGTISAPQGGLIGVRPPGAGSVRGAVPPRRRTWSCRQTASPSRHRRHVWAVEHAHATSRGHPGASRRSSRPSRPGAVSRARWRGRWWRHGATGRAARTPDRSCMLSGARPQTLPVGRGGSRAGGPRPGMPRRGVPWAQGPGPPAIRPTSGGISHAAWQSAPPRSRPSVGRPRSDAAHGSAPGWPRATRSIRSWSPWPEHGVP